MTRLRVTFALAALAFAGSCSAADGHIGKPSATSPPAQFATTGRAATAVDPLSAGKPTATSPLVLRDSTRPVTLIADALPVVPGATGKPSATSPPARWTVGLG